MIKKLLNKISSTLFYNSGQKKIEDYLAQSNDLTDLENRMKELDRCGVYNKFYI